MWVLILIASFLPCVVSYLYYAFSSSLEPDVRFAVSLHGVIFTSSFILSILVGSTYPSGANGPNAWANFPAYLWLIGLASVLASLWLAPVKWSFHLLHVPSMAIAWPMLVGGAMISRNEAF
jgi:hypothetical protein